MIAEEIAKQIAVEGEDRSHTDIVVKSATGKVVHKTPIKSDPELG